MTCYLDLLPDDILNEIMFEYWYDKFKKTIIAEIDLLAKNISTIKNFIQDHYFLGFYQDDDFNNVIPVLDNISLIIEEMGKNKYTRLILSKHYKSIDICLSNEYIENCLSDVSKKYKNVAALCINNCHTESRFNLKYRFSMLK